MFAPAHEFLILNSKFLILAVYVELHAASAFSFLQGASLPETLVERAAELGYSALALLATASTARPAFTKPRCAPGCIR